MGAVSLLAYAAAILGREVAADVVVSHLVAIRAGEQADGACQVGAAVGENAVMGDDHVVVLVVVGRTRQVRRAQAEGAAVRPAAALHAAAFVDRVVAVPAQASYKDAPVLCIGSVTGHTAPVHD